MPFSLAMASRLWMAPAHSASVNSQLNNMVETAKTNGQEPYAGLFHVLERLPLASRVEDYEMLLPAAVKLLINGSTVKRKTPPKRGGIYGAVTVDQYPTEKVKYFSQFPAAPKFIERPHQKVRGEA